MYSNVLQKMRQLIQQGRIGYSGHAEYDMDNDGISRPDVKHAIFRGRIVERQLDRDTGEYKYRIFGHTHYRINIEVLAKIEVTDDVVIITAYLVLAKDKPMYCSNCGKEARYITHIPRAYSKDGGILVVENVPAFGCYKCGMILLTDNTVAQLERLRDSRSDIPTHPVHVASFQDEADAALAEMMSGTALCSGCGREPARIRRRTNAYGAGESLLVIENVPTISCRERGMDFLTPNTEAQIERLRSNLAIVPLRDVHVASFQDEPDPLLDEMRELATAR